MKLLTKLGILFVLLGFATLGYYHHSLAQEPVSASVSTSIPTVSPSPTPEPTLSPTPVATPTATPTTKPTTKSQKPKANTNKSTKATKSSTPLSSDITEGVKESRGKKWVGMQPGWVYPMNSFSRAPQYKGHFGIDFNSGNGTYCGDSVYAVETGTVVEAAWGWNSGYGNTILILHDNGIYTRYAHLQDLTVFSGRVSKHQEIGHVGNSGHTFGGNGCHLHWEAYTL